MKEADTRAPPCVSSLTTYIQAVVGMSLTNASWQQGNSRRRLKRELRSSCLAFQSVSQFNSIDRLTMKLFRLAPKPAFIVVVAAVEMSLEKCQLATSEKD
ncbi:unnamed protein product [Polarella glacialis]|uniref:Uncharacterized protein n=1 Tax=Polarella glacialis TaxID=89957 RepID=A0A813KYH9_POLGL|nr:unnamed protein product [Polarella glacialis]